MIMMFLVAATFVAYIQDTLHTIIIIFSVGFPFKFVGGCANYCSFRDVIGLFIMTGFSSEIRQKVLFKIVNVLWN